MMIVFGDYLAIKLVLLTYTHTPGKPAGVSVVVGLKYPGVTTGDSIDFFSVLTFLFYCVG